MTEQLKTLEEIIDTLAGNQLKISKCLVYIWSFVSENHSSNTINQLRSDIPKYINELLDQNERILKIIEQVRSENYE